MRTRDAARAAADLGARDVGFERDGESKELEPGLALPVVKAPGARPVRVLAIDDHPDILLLVELTLRRAGFEVETVSHPGRVLTLLDRNEFDAVILDLSLPEISGLELLRRIRDNPRHRDLPVIIVSAHAEGSDRVRGLREGANDYLAKPFEPEELLLRLGKMVADRIASESARAAHQLSGSLEAYPLWDLLQSLERSGRSGRISIERGARTIDLTLRQGHLVHSEVLERGMVSLVGEEAALVALTGTDGTFRFFDEEPRVPAEARPVDLANLLMTAAWLGDEMAARAPYLPDWDEPLKLRERGAIEVPPELMSPGGERVLGALVAEPSSSRRLLNERGLAAPITIDLLLATLAQRGALVSLDPEAASRREQRRVEAALERLQGGSDKGDPSKASHFLLVASASAWHRFIAQLGAWTPPFEGWWERLETIARERGGSIQLGGSKSGADAGAKGPEASLHLLALDASTLARAENVLPLCRAGGIWWDLGDESGLAATLIERSRSFANFRSGLWIPIDSAESAEAGPAPLARQEKWRLSDGVPGSLSSFLEGLT